MGEYCNTGWSSKTAQSLWHHILQPYIRESCGFQKNVLKEILYMIKVNV